MQVCTTVSGNTVVIASGKPFRPSTTAIRMSLTPRGTVGSFVLRPSASLSDEPFAEHDGELGPGLEPFARRPLPLVGLAIEDQI